MKRQMAIVGGVLQHFPTITTFYSRFARLLWGKAQNMTLVPPAGSRFSCRRKNPFFSQ
jgi:hypothetical protein